MTGQDYLTDIKTELQSGSHRNRKGKNLLGAFGYVRRRKTVIREINETLEYLGLLADPPITTEMPLEGRIKFSLSGAMSEPVNAADSIDTKGPDTSLQDEEDDDDNMLEPTFTFTVSELPSAETEVECVPLDATIKKAYTKMRRYNYSQLVVASRENPRQNDIKGILSFDSLSQALMNGTPATVRDCIDTNEDVQYTRYDADLESVVNQLSENDVVLVLGRDNKLQGIVTAWDLANEFANLIAPFKRIEEIERRLEILIKKRLGPPRIAEFLGVPVKEIRELTMGDLQRVLELPDNWDKLKLPFERVDFIEGLDDVRNYRNRLMHFGDPLDKNETEQLTNFCKMVREIQL